jgi:hypothetical protein
VLQTVIIRQQGPESPLRHAVGTDIKGKVSPAFYLAGILSALTIDRNGHIGVRIALACFVGVAIIWIVPDRRIDRVVREYETRTDGARCTIASRAAFRPAFGRASRWTGWYGVRTLSRSRPGLTCSSR